jgi:hypothetical protein
MKNISVGLTGIAIAILVVGFSIDREIRLLREWHQRQAFRESLRRDTQDAGIQNTKAFFGLTDTNYFTVSRENGTNIYRQIHGVTNAFGRWSDNTFWIKEP